MTRIEPPAWATQPALHIGDVAVSDYASIQRRREQLLRVVHQAVEDYLNDPQLYFTDDNEGFPNRERLTGQYYVADESYTAHEDPAWFQIGVMCRCLERPRGRSKQAGDYLGLEVWLKCVPGRWSFSVFRNTDSSSI
ncbi:MAG: hypothetical protein JNM56_24230 [Planctomycetia bacterium]|nr:hypothetical protein [Planctomycetia bacterium]